MARPEQNAELLQEIRDTHDYYVSRWQRIWDEGDIDMKFIMGDPWDAKEKAFRASKEVNRPCLAFDEFGQYLNQLQNEYRQNPRGIKVLPGGKNADDKTAELRGNLIRGIESRSNAKTAYFTALESAAQRGFGYFRIGTRYIDQEGNQEIYIGRIPNPKAILLDPDAQEVDCSDGMGAFVDTLVPRSVFKRRYPNAEVTDFNSSLFRTGRSSWVKGEYVQVSEYWKVTLTPGKFMDDRVVKQYITNGAEILEANAWPGKWIPIIPMFGKEMYYDYGMGEERVLMSMVRLARDPYRAYCYTRTTSVELIGMLAKAPVVGYEGQFAGHETEWETAHRIPRAYLQVKAIMDATGQNVLPLPQRAAYQADIAASEIASESFRRAIQSAMGISALPTTALRKNEKSGVALQEIRDSEQKGSYHFIDNAERALEFAGKVIVDLLPKVIDTERELGAIKKDESYEVVKVNPESPEQGADAKPWQVLDDAPHDVMISTGPSFQSQREETQAFVDGLIGNQQFIQLGLANPQSAAAKILALAIRMRQLGPLGDEMADAVDPSTEMGDVPPQALAIIQKLDTERKALDAYSKELEEELGELRQMQQAKVLELGSKERIASMDNATKMEIAELQAAGEAMLTRMQAEFDALQAKLEAQIAPPPAAGGGFEANA